MTAEDTTPDLLVGELRSTVARWRREATRLQAFDEGTDDSDEVYGRGVAAALNGRAGEVENIIDRLAASARPAGSDSEGTAPRTELTVGVPTGPLPYRHDDGEGWTWDGVTGDDTEPLHEVGCPACGATIRARMADAESGDSGRVVVTLPPPDGHEAAVDADERPCDVPSWDIEMLNGRAVTAWTEGVAVHGDLHEGAAVDRLWRDATAILAAITAHQRVAAGSDTTTAETED